MKPETEAIVLAALREAEGEVEEYAGLAKPPVKRRVERVLAQIQSALDLAAKDRT